MAFRPQFNADLGGDVGVVDLAPWVLEWTLIAGKESGVSYPTVGVPLRFEARLNNSDGRFSKTNPDSRYHGRLDGGGFLDVTVPGEGRLCKARLLPFELDSGESAALAKLTAVGALYELQQSEVAVPLQRDIRSDELVGYICRRSGLGAAQQDLAEGTKTLPRFWSPLAKGFDLIQAPVIFEGGHLYDSRDYGVTFLSRDSRTFAPLNQVAARVGGEGNIRATSYGDGGEFDVLINRATVPFSAYREGDPELLWEWSGDLLVPAYELLAAEDGNLLQLENGDYIIVEAPTEQQFAVEISLNVPSAIDWSQCTLSVTATIGDITGDCQIAPVSATQALVSVPRREQAFLVTAITVRGPITRRDPLGQETYRDAPSILEYGLSRPEVVPSWHSDRVAARQNAVDLVLGLKDRATIGKLSFPVRGAAEDAWKRWVSERVAVDVTTREGVVVDSAGTIERLEVSQTGPEDPICDWTLSGVGRGLASEAGITLASVLNRYVTAGQELSFELPRASGGMGEFEYEITGLPDWLARSGFTVSGRAPLISDVHVITWTATDTELDVTLGRSFSVTVGLITLPAPRSARSATEPDTDRVALTWDHSQANVGYWEVRVARAADDITQVPWAFDDRPPKLFLVPYEATRYRMQVRAQPAPGSVYDTSPATEVLASTTGTFTLGSVADFSGGNGDQVSITLPAAGGGTGNFAYELSGAPAWLVRDGFSLSGTVAETISRTYDLAWKVIDLGTGFFPSTLTSTARVTITVPFALEAIDDISIDGGADLEVTLPAAVGGSSGEFGYELTGDVPDWVELSGRTLTGTAPELESTTHEISWTATDGTETVTRTFDLSVVVPLTLPAVPDIELGPRVGLTLNLPSASGASPPYSYQLTGAPDWLSVTDQVLSGTAPALTLNQSWQLTWTATDSAGETASASFEVAVKVPVAISFIADIGVRVGGALAASLPAASGGDGDYEYELTGAPDWVMRDGRSLTGTAPDAAASSSLTWTVTDGEGESASRTFRLVVAALAPLQIGEIEDVALLAGGALALTLPQASGGDGSYTYQLSGAPDWVMRDGRALSGTAPASAGSDTLTWTVTDGTGTSASRSFKIAVSLPIAATPAGLAAGSITDSSFILSWSAVTGASGYEVRWAIGGFTASDAWTAVSARQFRVTGLARNTLYQVQVRALRSNHSPSSPAELSVRTSQPVLSAPLNLSIVTAGEDFLTIRWSPNQLATRYEVRHSAGQTASGAWRSIGAGTTSGAYRTYTISGLTPATAYRIEVRAAASGYQSSAASGVSGSTTAATRTRLAAPGSLAAGSITSTSMSISWANVANATSYELRYAAGKEPDGSWAAATSPHALSGLAANSEYHVQVRAVGTGSYRTGPASTVRATTLIAAPAQLHAETAESDSLTWAWNAVTGAQGYEYRHALSSANFAGSWTDVEEEREVTISGLTSNTEYKLQVRAYDEDDRRGAVASATARTEASGTQPRLAAPKVIGSYNRETGLVAFNWPAVPNATSYSRRLVITDGEGRTTATRSTGSPRIQTWEVDQNTRSVAAEIVATASGYRDSAAGKASVLVGTPLSAPNVATSAIGADRFTLSWPAVTNSSGYEYRYAEGEDAPEGKWTAITSPRVIITGLEREETYTAQVRAVGVGQYLNSPATQVQVTTIDVPDAPGNFRATGAGYNSISWAWNAAAGATGYEIRIARTGQSFPATWTNVGNKTAFSTSGLSDDTAYTAQVRAYDQAGGRGAPAEASRRTDDRPPRLSRPSVRASPSSFSWSPVPNATSYSWTQRYSYTTSDGVTHTKTARGTTSGTSVSVFSGIGGFNYARISVRARARGYQTSSAGTATYRS